MKNLNIIINFIFFLIILFSSLFSNGQKNKTDSLFNIFKNNIKVEILEDSGVVDFDDETKISYYSLLDNCTNEDLIKLLDDSIPIIRAYMFYGLLRNCEDTILLKQILNNHINDTAIF